MGEREKLIIHLRQRVVDLEKSIAASKSVVDSSDSKRLRRMEADLAEITARLVELTEEAPDA
jgi:hypothetical protein